MNCAFWYSLHFEIMQYIPKSIRITKFCLNCAISYNLHFEIMQCIPKSIRIAKFYLNYAINYNLHFEIMQCIFCEYGMWYMTMLVSTFIE